MTKIRISPLFFLMAAGLVVLGYGYEFVSYFAAVILHEMAHAEVAKKLGYALDGIKLMPYGASLTGAFEGVRPRDEILIAVAGPLCNVLLAILFVAIWWLIPAAYFFTETFVYSNTFTAALNLLPVFPLDGGRAALAALSVKIPRQKAYRFLRIFGFALAAAFGVLFALSLFYSVNPTYATFSLFILFSTVFPDKSNKYTRLYSMAYRSEKLKRGLPVKEIMVHETATLDRLLKMCGGNCYHRFLAVGDDFLVRATIDESALETLAAVHGGSITVRDAAKIIKYPKK